MNTNIKYDKNTGLHNHRIYWTQVIKYQQEHFFVSGRSEYISQKNPLSSTC